MPVGYRNYPHHFLSHIRPTVLTHAGNQCAECGVPNHAHAYRGKGGAFHLMSGTERGEMVGEFKISSLA